MKGESILRRCAVGTVDSAFYRLVRGRRSHCGIATPIGRLPLPPEIAPRVGCLLPGGTPIMLVGEWVATA